MNPILPIHFAITQTTWTLDAKALSFIRTQVFVIEQQVPETDEWDNQDEDAIHFLVHNETQEPIACARLLNEFVDGQDTFHIGRVAVLQPFRSLGIGRSLMRYTVDYCKNLHPTRPIFLNAQIAQQDFYQHLQFIARGEIFMDANIPHIEMWYSP